MRTRFLVFIIMMALGAFSEIAAAIIHTDRLDTGDIPFEMVKNAIVISVEIQGVKYKFVLDTGGYLMISDEMQGQHHFEELDKITVSDIRKKSKDFTTVHVPQLVIGQAIFKDRRAIVSEGYNQYPNKCFGTDGIIGRDFFGDKLLQIDYKHKVLRLAEDESVFQLNRAHQTKMKTSKRGLPSFALKINGKKEYVEFDSGSGDFFSYKTSEAEKIRMKSPEKILEYEGIFSFGVSDQGVRSTTRYRVKVEDFILGKTHFGSLYSDLSKRSAPRVGAGILYYGKLTLDYKNGRMYYEPYAEKHSLPAHSAYDFAIAYVQERFIIKWVRTGSAAEQQGLTYGDEVLKINSHPLTQDGKLCERYLHGYPYEDEASVELLVRKLSGAEMHFRLEKQTYD